MTKHKTRSLFVFGNSDVAQDSLALIVAKKLEEQSKGKYTFYHSSRPESLLTIPDDNITVLDVARGVNTVQVVDVSQLKNQPSTSLHDFDLGFFLRLVAELEPQKKFRIIAIPQTGDVNMFAKTVSEILDE